MKLDKQRLDLMLVQRGLAESQQRAAGLILAGEVFVDGRKIDKAGTLIAANASIEIRGDDIPYVSRGGLKLEAALKEFEIDVTGLNCMDVGASTGGFTDCLLQHGAQKVVAVDVGYGQMHWRIRNDPRVTLLERTNIRYLKENAITIEMDLACIDVSFISLRLVVPRVAAMLRMPKHIICLIKPQFEVGKGVLGKGGLVKDSTLHDSVLADLAAAFDEMGLHCGKVVPSPILGAKGNKEFLAHIWARNTA